MEASKYSTVETLCCGLQLEIRALRPDDRENFISAVGQVSPQSLYRRFFAIRRDFSEEERSFFVNVDFISHVALIAVVKESGQPLIVGGARYIVDEPGRAEVAFTVVDRYQGKGIGSALMRHLTAVARSAGLHELTAEVLPENSSMLRTFERCGLSLDKKYRPGTVSLSLKL